MKYPMVLALIFALAGCSPNAGRYGIYRYQAPSGSVIQLELKANDEVIRTDKSSGSESQLGGKYTIEGDKLTTSFVAFGGMTVVSKAHFDGNAIVLDDSTLFNYTGEHLTRQ